MRKPDWSIWKHMQEVGQSQACALAMSIDPDSLELNSEHVGYAIYSLSGRFESEEISQQFSKLERLLKAHRFRGRYFTLNGKADVLLDEFAEWCVEIDQDIPHELKAMAKPKTQPVEAVEPATEQNKQNNDNYWRVLARKIGIKIHKENPRLSLDQIAKKTHEQLVSQNITGRGNKVPSASTIRRHALIGIKS